jgi:hypothetical protein
MSDYVCAGAAEVLNSAGPSLSAPERAASGSAQLWHLAAHLGVTSGHPIASSTA